LDSTYLHSVVTEHQSGLHILPGPVGGDAPDSQSLYLILEQLRQTYDYVIVDTAYSPEANLPKELESADRIFITLQLSLPCLAHTAKLVETIRLHDPDAERRMTLIANRVTKDTTIGVAEAAEVLSREIPYAIPEDGPSALSALNQGTPLVTAYPKSAAAREIIKLAKSLDNREQATRKSFTLPFASLFKRKKKQNAESLAGAPS
jgi:pilus assembly protein CpaE